MKSIKEKAEEFSFMEEGTDLNGVPYKDYNSYKMDGFEKGANYVIDVLEEFMLHNLVHSGNIKRLIEQLKK